MSLSFNKLSMLLIAWLLTWLLLPVWGLELCQHNTPQVIPEPPFIYRFRNRKYNTVQSNEGYWKENARKSKKDWNDRKAHRLKIEMTNLEEEEKRDQIKDTQIKQALMKMMNKKLKDNKLGERHRNSRRNDVERL